MRYRLLIMFGLCVVCFWASAAVASDKPADVVTVAMCRPTIGQIKNIEIMFDQDVIPLTRMKLIGVYHEDENVDYEEVAKYIKDNDLLWVSLFEITGTVEKDGLFRQNNWTSQFRKLFDSTDGIIFTGGSDVLPAIYKEERHLMTDAEQRPRITYEVSFMFHLLGGSRNPDFAPFLETRPDYPVLGLCLGSQVMNVATGGSLVQDIPQEIYNLRTVEEVLAQGVERVHSSRYSKAMYPDQDYLPPAMHSIILLEDSIFVREMNMKVDDQPWILSSHHQSNEKLGHGLRAAATSRDGKIMEAIQHNRYPNVLGVQFHPEYHALYRKGMLYRRDPLGDDMYTLREFLEKRPPSMEFHRKIWAWFAAGLGKKQ